MDMDEAVKLADGASNEHLAQMLGKIAAGQHTAFRQAILREAAWRLRHSMELRDGLRTDAP